MTQIQVTANYRGALTGERLIEPGIYDANDPALFGLAQYLVETQRKAVWVGSAPTPVPPAPVVADDEPDPREDEAPVAMPVEDEPQSDDEPEQASTPYQDYDSMSVKELKALMEFRSIEEPEYGTGNNGAVLKRDLVAALTEADHYEDGDAA